MYESLKLIHQLTVFATILLFMLRFSMIVRSGDRALPRTLKIVPHVNDTLLLAVAIGMLGILGMNPFTTPWLQAKLAALLAYILTAAICLKSVPRSGRQAGFFVVAVSLFSYMVLVALSKQPNPF